MKLKAWHIVSEAVENGIARGYMRAYKHTDAPDEHYLKEQIEIAVMGELSEIIDFDVPEDLPRTQEGGG